MTPEQEEQVRRALAAAARPEQPDGPGPHGPTMPPEVAARLDGVLSGLVAERSATSSASGAAARAGDVIDAGADELNVRRRRRWPQVLVAAAAVSVIAVGGGTAALRGLTSDGSDDRSAGSGVRAEAGGGTAQRDAPSDAAGAEALAPVAVPRVRSAALASDVQRLLDSGAVSAPTPVPSVPSSGESGKDAPGLRGGPAPTGCATPTTGVGEDLLVVRLDGEPATLVLGRPADGARVVRAYPCDDARVPVAGATVRDR